ncbi:DUF3137 domain-containing protein [Pseudemcibacter aquimaris]|uniref:DUF3137 domain-containing protein n=1 Tax=Pseudemcibacter aquimaris TaxID=2857064 RepID=UPI00201270AE|nr:DUF3137 domain-containing protein [Pseudemcibacter aquimaris]MCC3860286.1 DUF3137 domain-containing protein [Pseudemcibacter aquimaris]WDU57611.1 DUF3137 domain-containing protein [Pseudemcibacter aquimaris]
MTIEEMRAALHSFDDSGLKPILDKLEERRKAAFKRFLTVVFIVGFVVFFMILTMGMTDLVEFSIAGAVLISIFFYSRLAVIRREAKEKLMPLLCVEIGLDYNVAPSGAAIRPYDDLNIIPSYDEKTLEDQISGNVEDIDFNLLEAKLVNVSRDSKGRTTRTTVFQGFLVEFDFHKNFTAETIITKDRTVIGNFLTNWTKNGDKVKLEDPNFEREFEVHSTDQVEARYLLTPMFMERVLQFNRLPSVKQLQMAFSKGKIYMAIKRKGNAFEGGSFNLNDPKLIEQNIKDIAVIFDVVTELNLTQETKV